MIVPILPSPQITPGLVLRKDKPEVEIEKLQRDVSDLIDFHPKK